MTAVSNVIATVFIVVVNKWEWDGVCVGGKGFAQTKINKLAEKE